MILILLCGGVGEGRVILTVRAQFNPGGGLLTVRNWKGGKGVQGWILKHAIKISALQRGGWILSKGGLDLSIIPGMFQNRRQQQIQNTGR